jgi:hypothetical protein
VDHAAAAEHHASAGHIVLTDGITELLKDVIRTRPHHSFHRFIRFQGELPDSAPCILPAVDVDSSRIFMPEDVIVHDMRGEFRQIVNLFIRIPDLLDEKHEQYMSVDFQTAKEIRGPAYAA